MNEQELKEKLQNTSFYKIAVMRVAEKMEQGIPFEEIDLLAEVTKAYEQEQEFLRVLIEEDTEEVRAIKKTLCDDVYNTINSQEV